MSKGMVFIMNAGRPLPLNEV